MNYELITIGLAVGGPIIGAGVWLVRLEGRIDSHEQTCAERQKKLDERHMTMGKKLDHIDAKLDRLIEAR